jgi:hypothetical protein
MKTKSLAEKLTKHVDLDLHGEHYKIVIDHNLLIEVEDLVPGLNVLTGDANLFKPSAKLLRAILYLALQRDGAKYSLAQVGDLITAQSIKPIQVAILAAWSGAWPEAEPEDAVKDPNDETADL